MGEMDYKEADEMISRKTFLIPILALAFGPGSSGAAFITLDELTELSSAMTDPVTTLRREPPDFIGLAASATGSGRFVLDPEEERLLTLHPWFTSIHAPAAGSGPMAGDFLQLELSLPTFPAAAGLPVARSMRPVVIPGPSGLVLCGVGQTLGLGFWIYRTRKPHAHHTKVGR
jgi:hypothetical protein